MITWFYCFVKVRYVTLAILYQFREILNMSVQPMRFISSLFLMLCSLIAAPFTYAEKNASTKTAYNFSFTQISGQGPLNLSQFKGKVLLIVNTASKCGFTPQYKALEKLYETYKDRGLVIIGVPSNDFANQEPGSNQDIAHFCQINYGVTFPMTSKEIVTGAKAHPFYQWARSILGWSAAPKWNFHKYLINRQGQLVDYFSSITAPDSPRVKQAIETLLQTTSA